MVQYGLRNVVAALRPSLVISPLTFLTGTVPSALQVTGGEGVYPSFDPSPTCGPM